MTTYLVNTQFTYSLMAGENLTLLGTGALVSDTGSALSSITGSHQIRSAGTIISNSFSPAISLRGASSSAESVLTFSSSSTLMANWTAIDLNLAEARITNAGFIQADTAIQLGSAGNSNGMGLSFTNTGTVVATVGIWVVATPSSSANVYFVNYGSILCANSGTAFLNQHSNGGDYLKNFGMIEGNILTYAQDDTVINRGSILGFIDLGSGNDRLDVRSAISELNAYLRDGNDVVILGAAAETVDGGLGRDEASYYYASAVTLNLTNAELNAGDATGDVLTGIEFISGSRAGSDNIVGDAAANGFSAFGGNDVLAGMAGADTLWGGSGSDRISGGTGNDVFQFKILDVGSDVVSDFSGTTTNNDRIELFIDGTGLLTGALAANAFQSRADNLAQDADDRFIFRTTDRTLWYDSNGNAAGGLKMIADFQAGAVVQASDFLLRYYVE
jgi:Ca2+-binding RTX toxin-like protein